MPEFEAKAFVSDVVSTMTDAYGGKRVLNKGQYLRLLGLCDMVELLNQGDEVENFMVNAEAGSISLEIPILTFKTGRSAQLLAYMKNADYTDIRESGGVLLLTMGVERLWSKVE